MKIFVGNLTFHTTGQDLQNLFSKSGTVQSANVITDRMTGRSRGFAFVEMSSKEECSAAIADFNGKEMNGRSLTVNEAKEMEPRTGNGYKRDNFGSGNRNSGKRGNNPTRNDERPSRWD